MTFDLDIIFVKGKLVRVFSELCKLKENVIVKRSRVKHSEVCACKIKYYKCCNKIKYFSLASLTLGWGSFIILSHGGNARAPFFITYQNLTRRVC